MKKIIFFIFIAHTLFSCSSNKPIDRYMRGEIELNKSKSLRTMLYDKKMLPSKTLEMYYGTKIHAINTQAKSFKQEDFDYLTKKYPDKKTTSYWNETDSKQLGFVNLVKTSLPANMRPMDKDVLLYQLSDVLFVKNKKSALFNVSVSKAPGLFIEMYVVVMKKENGCYWKKFIPGGLLISNF